MKCFLGIVGYGILGLLAGAGIIELAAAHGIAAMWVIILGTAGGFMTGLTHCLDWIMTTAQFPTQRPGGTSSPPQILGFVGLVIVCVAAILAFFLGFRIELVFYFWILGLVAQFAAGIWALYRRAARTRV
jgi:hypothetical protein